MLVLTLPLAAVWFGEFTCPLWASFSPRGKRGKYSLHDSHSRWLMVTSNVASWAECLPRAGLCRGMLPALGLRGARGLTGAEGTVARETRLTAPASQPRKHSHPFE